MSRRGARDVEDGLPIRSLDEPSSPMGHRRTVSDIGVGSSHRSSSSDINVGSLLRFFKSEFFTPWIRVSYLYKYTNPGIHDYICNSLYSMMADDIEYYLVQLINMLVHANLQSNGLERFLLDQCSKSIHLALQVSWLLQAAVVDSPIHRDRCFRLQEQVEIATVNCARPLPLETLHMLAEVNASVMRNAQASSNAESATSTTSSTATTTTSTAADSSPDPANTTEESATPPPVSTDSQLPTPMPSSTNESLEFALSKMDRCEYFNQVLDFVEELGRISDRLRAVAVPQRQEGLRKEISEINTRLPVGLYLPLWEASRTHFCIVRLAADESVVLKSRERVPYIVYFELIEGNESCASEDLHKVASSYNDIMQEVRKQHLERQSTPNLPDSTPPGSPARTPDTVPAASSSEAVSGDASLAAATAATPTPTPSASAAIEPEAAVVAQASSEPRSASPTQSSEAIKTPPRSAIFEEDAVLPASTPSLQASPPSSSECAPSESKRSPFGEPYIKRKERIRSQSPYGHLPTWNLASVIVKYGDDCRQEQLAMQLIQQFKAIFEESGLPLYVRPYRILVTTASSGLIETLFDAVSLHQLKQFYQQENSSLSYHFRQYYGDPESPRHQAAVRNFVESLAGYSLVTYLLQIKDRHNGNIMIDSHGHLIHIDFGFMLSNSPGALNTESAPFKLTQDWVDLMGGTESPFFQHFKTLLTRGFLEIRKHCDKFLMLVEIMAVGSKLPCFYAGAATVDALRERFHISMTEAQIVSYVEEMITRSWDNWRTQIYDHFQYLTNGILA